MPEGHETEDVARDALYFPNIDVPQGPWLTNTLLYWDSVRSIVPVEVHRRDDGLSPFTKSLCEHGLIKPVYPEAAGMPGFATEFIGLLQLELPRIHGGGGNWRPFKVHIEKLGSELRDELIDLGVARESAEPWFLEMQPRAAELFMAFLACVLASTSAEPMQPVSDEPRHLELYGLRHPRPHAEDRAAMREGFLQELLPTVDQEMDLASLQRFKDRNGDHLRAYRAIVEAALSRVLRVVDPDERAAVCVRERASLRSQQAEVEARLSEAGWKVGTAWSLIGVVAAAADAAAGAPPLATMSHGVLGAAAFAINRMRRRRTTLSLPLAYGALVSQRARKHGPRR